RGGKSCRLRWLNSLRPGIRRGKFTPQEEEAIIKLHAVLGNRWAAIAKEMENRTDNDIKNHWNSCLKKRLQHDLDRIKNILLDRKITINDQDEEGGLRRDQKIGEEDDFLIWDDGEVRRYMDIDPMEYETTPYDSVLYESTQILDF
ncbi:hypothetical protein HID58_065246, partial [Brassica napus]